MTDPTPRPDGVHLIGLGGAGVSALARLYRDQGRAVSGSDLRESPALEALRAVGVDVRIGHGADNLPATASEVVASASIRPENPELAAAVARGLPVRKYAEALGRLFATKPTRIAIAGTHGKTTTSGLVAYTMSALGLDPAYVVGAAVPSLGRNAAYGSGDAMAVEACEFDRSFHQLAPTVGVVTNIEADHLDYYKDLDEIHESFIEFAAGIPEDGLLVVHESCAQLFRRARNRVRCRVTSYGISRKADWRVEAIHAISGGGTRFRIRCGEWIVCHGLTSLSGQHNALNSLGALVAMRAAGVDMASSAACLPGYSGATRRFQQIALTRGIEVLDDYAHHPTEVRAVLQAARSAFGRRRIIAVFQPHQYSRTRQFLSEFGDSFGNADEVIVPEIYAARDRAEDMAAVGSEDLVAELTRRGVRASFCKELDQIALDLVPRLVPGDVVITMGAGDVDRLARRVGQQLREAV